MGINWNIVVAESYIGEEPVDRDRLDTLPLWTMVDKTQAPRGNGLFRYFPLIAVDWLFSFIACFL